MKKGVTRLFLLEKSEWNGKFCLKMNKCDCNNVCYLKTG